MTKQELVKAVSQKSGCTQHDTECVINATCSSLADALVRGERIALPGLGTFKTSPTKARTCRNPMTGAAIQVPAGRKVVFVPAPKLKEDVNA